MAEVLRHARCLCVVQVLFLLAAAVFPSVWPGLHAFAILNQSQVTSSFGLRHAGTRAGQSAFEDAPRRHLALGALALGTVLATRLRMATRQPASGSLSGRPEHSLLRATMQPQLPDAGIAIIDKVDRKAQMKEQFDKEKWWRVLLHNDDIHTFEYVTGSLTKVVQHLTRRKAYNITWEAHSAGKATVATVWKAQAEQYCVALQKNGLTVSIAPDSKFEGNKDGS